MADKRDIDDLIERALREGAEVSIVNISPKFSSPGAAEPLAPPLARPLQPPEAGAPGEASSDALVMVDPADGRILEANGAALRLLGVTSAGTGPETLASIDTGGRLAALVHGVAESARPAVEEMGFQSLDGRSLSGEVAAVRRDFRGRVAIQLILATRPAPSAGEAELRHALGRSLSLLDGLPDAALLVDAEGAIALANEAAGGLFGRAPASLLGMQASALFAETDGERLKEHLAAFLEEPLRADSIRTLELAGRGADLRDFPGAVSLRPLILDGKRVVAMAVRDLSPDTEAAIARAQALGRFHQAERLDALGRLAGGIAADVNNILGSILGYADLALDDLPPGHKGRSSVEHVLKAGRRGKVLVRQMLAFGRGEPRAERRVRLDDLVRQTLDLARPGLSEDVALAAEVTAKTAAVMGDEAELHQVILNLIRNSGQALEGRRGRIEIMVDAVDVDADFAAHPIPPEGDVALAPAARPVPRAGTAAQAEGAEAPDAWAHAFIGRLEAGPYVRLTVADNGAGMDRATLAHIFEPFFTTRKVGEGSGLGLAVVHGIVTGSNGAILATSAPGKGSRFEVFLPRSYRAAELMAEEMVPAGTLTQRVMVVDDEADLAELSRRALDQLGIRVDAMASGVAALEAFRANPDRWKLIIADQVMPGMSGETLSRELLRMRPDLPIILCSGYPKTITLERIKAAGIREFVMKPVDQRQLAKVVRQVLEDSARARA